MCGGTIINKRYVLTAMHCLSDARQNKHPVDKVRVVVGEHNICDGVNEGGQVMKWSFIFLLYLLKDICNIKIVIS